MRTIGQPDRTTPPQLEQNEILSVPAVNLSPWAQLKSEHKGKFLLSFFPAFHQPHPPSFSAPGSHTPLPVPRSPRILAARVGDRSETLKPYKAHPCPTHRGQRVQVGLAWCGLDKLTPHFSSTVPCFSQKLHLLFGRAGRPCHLLCVECPVPNATALSSVVGSHVREPKGPGCVN